MLNITLVQLIICIFISNVISAVIVTGVFKIYNNIKYTMELRNNLLMSSIRLIKFQKKYEEFHKTIKKMNDELDKMED